MQPKLFLMLAVAVLVAVLVGGNPFLVKSGAGGVPAVPLRAAPASSGATLVGTGSSGPAAADWQEQRPVPPASFVEGHHANLPGEPVGASLRGRPQELAVVPECPDPLLRPLVVEVETAAGGAPVWVLRDGRRLQRNPIVGREPLLVPAPQKRGKAANGRPERP